MWYGTPKYRGWTQGAAECYARGCVCKDCPTFALIGKECKMKRAVLRLVQDYGIPSDDFEISPKFNNVIEIKEKEKQMFDDDLNLDYGTSYAPIVSAIKKGFESYDDFEKNTGISKSLLSVKFSDLFKSFANKNLIDISKDRTKKQALIDFIQSRLLDKNYTENTQINEFDVKVKRIKNNDNSELEKLRTENENLRKRITELENKPQKTFDFDIIKHELINQIEQLQTKLKAVELLESEFNL